MAGASHRVIETRIYSDPHPLGLPMDGNQRSHAGDGSRSKYVRPLNSINRRSMHTNVDSRLEVERLSLRLSSHSSVDLVSPWLISLLVLTFRQKGQKNFSLYLCDARRNAAPRTIFTVNVICFQPGVLPARV